MTPKNIQFGVITVDQVNSSAHCELVDFFAVPDEDLYVFQL